MLKDLKNHFPENSYSTPDNVGRYLLDRFFFGGRWAFYFKYLRLVFRCRSLALKGKYDDELWARSSLEIYEIVERCRGKIIINGLENLRKEKEPLIMVGNHMGTAETQLLPGIIEPIKHVTFVVKKSLTTGKVWGPIMRARNPIVVGRIDPRSDFNQVMKGGIENLNNGRSVFIFPQATRNLEFIPSQFNSLGIKLAKKAKVKIMPVALKTNFWGNGKYFKPFGRIDRNQIIHFSFGRALQIDGNGKSQHQEIIDYIQSHLKRWSRNL